MELSRTSASERWTVNTKAAREYQAHWIKGEPGKGASKNPNQIHTGQNSGYQAMGLAHLWGAKRILLLGYDFSHQGAKTHWHGNHIAGLANASGNFGRWSQSMRVMADDLEASGVEVVNCSRRTALKCFRLSTIDKELEGIK